MFRESAAWLRLPAGVAAAGGIATVLAAMISASVADVTGIVAGSALVLGTVFAFGQRRKILHTYDKEMETKRTELIRAIEQQMEHAIDLFYQEIAHRLSAARDFLHHRAQTLRAAARTAWTN